MSLHRLSLLAATTATAALLSTGALFAGTAQAATPVLTPASATGNCNYQVKSTVDVLNVRSGPGTNYSVINTLGPNVYLRQPTCSDWTQGPGGNGWWVYVEFSYGKGWVSTAYINGLP